MKSIIVNVHARRDDATAVPCEYQRESSFGQPKYAISATPRREAHGSSDFDIYLMAIVGLFGYVLQRLHIPLAPVVLGLVLGPTLEQQYRTALILSEGSHRIFIESWFAMSFFALTLLVVVWQIRSSLRERTTSAPPTSLSS